MKHSLLFLVALIAATVAVSAYAATADSTVVDTTSNGNLRYQHVDVKVDYAWTDPEKYDDVNLILVAKNGVLEKVIVEKNYHEDCEMFLRSGMVVKVYARPSGRLLKKLIAGARI